MIPAKIFFTVWIDVNAEDADSMSGLRCRLPFMVYLLKVTGLKDGDHGNNLPGFYPSV
jgi:hypothetical protein